MTSERATREFVVRFAAGEKSLAYSGIWRVWTARKTPDLYLAIRSLGGVVKASVHAPRLNLPTWKRHYGFVNNAKGDVAAAVRADGTSRHKATWLGADLGNGVTLEWRIFISAPALGKSSLSVGPEIALIPPPAGGMCLIVAVLLGPTQPTSGYPRVEDFDTKLLAEGRLSDGRRVWVTYCYVALGQIKIPRRRQINNPGAMVPTMSLSKPKMKFARVQFATTAMEALSFWTCAWR